MNGAETRQCQNCKSEFVIEQDDVSFYQKINVPPPTFCPECRMQRRMAYRNERVLHKRSCDLCKKSLISAYSPNAEFPVYCDECWWSDQWDPMVYGQEYDFSKSFLEHLKELQRRVPRAHMNNDESSGLINSVYTNCVGHLKNCYLVFGAIHDEDCSYCQYVNYSKDCTDVLYAVKAEGCYECFDIDQCYNVHFSQSSIACRDSYFLFDCRNCSDCIGCTGLRNKRYHILNQPYAKEEYVKKKKELQLEARSGLLRFRTQYLNELFYKTPRKYYHGQMNEVFSGDYVSESKNTHHAFYTRNAKDSKYLFWCNKAHDVHDYFAWGDVELLYDSVACGYNSYNCRFTNTSWSENKDLEYCSRCHNASSLFGCIGVRKKQFCILNKQYTETEYKTLRERIIAHMDNMPYRDRQGLVYRYGEFLPIELSPFPYADTVAQEHFPLSGGEIAQRGYVPQSEETREYQITRKTADLPDTITDVTDGILDDVIACAHEGTCNEQCTTAFKIIGAELQFYRKKGIPLPELCHNCRHALRVKLRNPLRLWHRRCTCVGVTSENGGYANTASHFHGASHCPNEFETSYSINRPEIVYCEQCYQAEVV